jgi:hypothetical protein
MRLESTQETETPAAVVRLTPGELQQVMNDAIQRHGQAERTAEQQTGISTLDDALEIARQLNIPEEHVRAAVRDRGRLKLREQRRALVRARRRSAFLGSLGLTVAAGLTALVTGTAVHLTWMGALLVTSPFLIVAVLLGFRWLAAPVTDAEADRTELMPVAGKCRVCGADAYAPNATFCEEHRYKGPG